MIRLRLPQVQIRTTDALIGIQTRQAQLNIRQPHADLHIEQPHAELNTTTKQPRLSIDQTEAWRDMGIMSALDKTKQSTGEARQKWLEGISRMSQEGNQLMSIDRGVDIAQVAKQKTTPHLPMPNITYIPKSFTSIKISYEPGEVTHNHQANKPVIRANAKNVEGNYEPYDIQIYLRQQPNIEITVDTEI